ncbi:hypothetical protein TorRG33x02_143220, partial [Trema orientale]
EFDFSIFGDKVVELAKFFIAEDEVKEMEGVDEEIEEKQPEETEKMQFDKTEKLQNEEMTRELNRGQFTRIRLGQHYGPGLSRAFIYSC